MKRVSKFFSFALIGLFLCICMMPSLFVAKIDYASADAAENEQEPAPETTIDPISDEFFTWAIQTTPRENKVVSIEKREITDNAGTARQYICLKWEEVEALRFIFNFSNTKPNLRFGQFSLTEIYTTTDDMQTPLAPMPNKNEPTSTSLFLNLQIDENAANYTFNYYVDSTYAVDKTETRSAGKDFGLYKFVLSYDYYIPTSADPIGQNTQRQLECYIAILPTEITEELKYEIARRDLQIIYSVTNERLMNKFVLWLSNDDVLAYVNPRYIKWSVTGRDSKNYPYVLDDNQRGDGGQKTVYDASPVPPYGRNFEFDSQGIEGHWDITCEIVDVNGEVIFTKTIKNLSTYRVEKPSNLWWILLIIFGSLFLILVLILAIYFIRKKHGTVW